MHCFWFIIAYAYGLAVAEAATFTAFLVVHLLYTLFWVTLSVCLGCVFRSRGPVVGVPILLALLGNTLNYLLERLHPDLPLYFPNAVSKLGQALIAGETPETLLPLAASAGWCVVFVAAGS